MSIIFAAPIPGQSLTTEPKGLPFERPPEIIDPVEALDLHVENMTNPEAIEDAMYFLEQGLDLVSLVEGILRSAVMEGIHSIDVSLIIAPLLHEYIKGLAIEADVDFNEGFDNPERDKALEYARDTGRAKDALRKLRKESGEPVKEAPTVEEPQQEEQEPEEVTPAPQGLMARR